MRSDDSIREDLAWVADRKARRLLPECGTEPVTFRLAADVSGLLDRASTAEAEVVRLRTENERLNRRLFPGQGEEYANEVERQRAVIDGLQGTVERLHIERDEAFAAGFEQVRRRCERAESELRQLRAALGLAVEQFTEYDEKRAYIRTGWVGATVVNAWRAALSSASTPEPCDGVCRNLGCTDDCQPSTGTPTETDQPNEQARPLQDMDATMSDEVFLRIAQLCDWVEANPQGWGGDMVVSFARTVRAALPDDYRRSEGHVSTDGGPGPEPTPEGEQP